MHLTPYLRGGEYAGVGVNYRLSGHATWPAQIYDCKAAILWIRANADQYGLDADRIAVWGRSAGGHLALMVGLTGEVAQSEGDLGPHTDVSSNVAAVVNYFGVTDILAMVGDDSLYFDRSKSDAPEALLIGGPLQENAATARAASPITHVSINDPPVITLNGTADNVVPFDQATRLHRALQNVGASSTLITITGAGHGDFPAEADRRAATFLTKHLLGRDVELRDEILDRAGAN